MPRETNQPAHGDGLDRGDPDREEIARVAYTYWESRGREDGHDVEDWMMAEQEVLKRRTPRPEERRREARSAA